MCEMRREYALYKGENLIASGSVAEIAKTQGVNPSSVLVYMSPNYKKRARNGMCLVLLTDDLMKTCEACEERKMLIQFYKSRSSKDGYQGKCISCTRQNKSGLRPISLNEDSKKVCRVCNEEKSISSFYKKAGAKDGYQSCCKDCTREGKNKRDLTTRSQRTPTARELEKMKWHSTLRILA